MPPFTSLHSRCSPASPALYLQKCGSNFNLRFSNFYSRTNPVPSSPLETISAATSSNFRQHSCSLSQSSSSSPISTQLLRLSLLTSTPSLSSSSLTVAGRSRERSAVRSAANSGGSSQRMSSSVTPSDPAAIMQKAREIVNADHKGGWDVAWQQSVTPWDMGGVTPAVQHLIDTHALPEDAKTVFVPGCGAGYDVLAFTEGGKRTAVGLDISSTALARAKEVAAGKPGGDAVTFLNHDFFTYTRDQPFDAIFDYTFFCALHPSMREEWGKKTASNLATSGTLFTLAFPLSDHEGGPPFAVSVKAYEEVLNPHGLFHEEIPTVSHPSREAKEKMLKWTRNQSAKF